MISLCELYYFVAFQYKMPHLFPKILLDMQVY